MSAKCSTLALALPGCLHVACSAATLADVPADMERGGATHITIFGREP